MINVLIADDHALIRRGLAQILEKTGDIKVVAEFGNGTEALTWLCKNSCDVALLDISMPGLSGIDLLAQMQKRQLNTRVMFISAYPEDQYALRLIKSGAKGYLNKECAPEEVVSAVRRVASGRRYISSEVVEMLTNEIIDPHARLPHETLSNREQQIFLLLAEAKTLTEVAKFLCLSPKTISTYRSRILEKMNLRNNVELMRYAIDKKLIG